MKNVILITLDTLRQDALGCYGQNKVLSPFIDSLQSKCLKFTKNQATGPDTQASCPGMLTSSYFLDHGAPGKLSGERTLISEPLKHAGITTVAFHSNPYLCGFLGWNRGWDKFYDSMEEEVSPESPFIKGEVLNKKVDGWLSTQYIPVSAKRLFLWVHYMDADEPYMPPQKYIDLVDPAIKIAPEDMFKLFLDVLKRRDATDESIASTTGYADGAVWVKATGTSGTTPDVNGTADNPCPWADALVVATAKGLSRFRIVNGETVTLLAACESKSLIGRNWTLAMGAQSIAGSYIEGATVTGAGSGSTSATFIDCKFGDGTNNAVTIPPMVALRCGVNCPVGYPLTAATAGNGQYVFTDCYSLVAGSGTPYFDFSPVTGTTGINFRRWSGSSHITSDSNCTGTMVDLDLQTGRRQPQHVRMLVGRDLAAGVAFAAGLGSPFAGPSRAIARHGKGGRGRPFTDPFDSGE